MVQDRQDEESYVTMSANKVGVGEAHLPVRGEACYSCIVTSKPRKRTAGETNRRSVRNYQADIMERKGGYVGHREGEKHRFSFHSVPCCHQDRVARTRKHDTVGEAQETPILIAPPAIVTRTSIGILPRDHRGLHRTKRRGLSTGMACRLHPRRIRASRIGRTFPEEYFHCRVPPAELGQQMTCAGESRKRSGGAKITHLGLLTHRRPQ
mmetsp:Transcript_27182/g.75964  ORF Transcript_27182/g.75964 Transcript_27182/m.75964 type:complete len:209 (-) Transcript_27182:399-1025(-)